MNWKAIVNVIASTVLPLVFPKLAPAVPHIVTGISVAEDMGGTGAEKLNKAIQIANSSASAVNAAHGSDIVNVDAMNTVIASAVSAIVNAANVVHKAAPADGQ